MPDSGMGHFLVPIEVGNRTGGATRRVAALVDTGSTYTWIPGDVLGELGVIPEEERVFVLADGRERAYSIGWVHVGIADRGPQPTIVVFGEPASEALLGVFTLEGFGLAVDPVNQRLISVPGLLKATAGA